MAATKYLQFLLDEIGHSVHNLNTIAVSLSNLPSEPTVNPSLNIRWEPKNVKASSISARRFAIRSSIVFATELLFEYLSSISDDVFWKSTDQELNFKKPLAAHDSKAKRFSEFCKNVPGIEHEWILLVELMCHWRNRIVHASTSKAQLSSSDRKYLEEKSSDIYNHFHHFDVIKTLSDYEADKVTLKEATTLITFLIKCCRKIDEYYFSSINQLSTEYFVKTLETDEQLIKIAKQQESSKRQRQIARYIKVTFSHLPEDKLAGIVQMYT
ncbi:hypothetical protein M3P05_20135 [Sansalvadorimonas sp. 2012CJ34-2]|uniref:Apea-like HEPN domain-containing protein n=1 Tax=Parendozoicomonas callyspongiae TaxID=2942213 RepID=A0ABT0PLI2_9GAMM|nr:hypothetical protein [Sansalvadorimonas sp. 2012CJ34-2]MCL6272234.1 hypothetical protein [Sansalvadorimonas sp. 2012CJ34-2]